MKNFCVIIIAALVSMAIPAKAGQNYAVKLIDTALLRNANAVVREHTEKIEINSVDEIVYTTRCAITILNEKGKSYADLRVYYSSISHVQSIDGWQYDAEGDEIASLKKKNVHDVGIVDNNFFDDNRVKFFRFDNVAYPYTVVFETEEKLDCTFRVPSWYPQPGFDVAVESADLEVTSVAGINIRWKALYIPDDKNGPVTQTRPGYLKADVHHLPAQRQPDRLTPENPSPLPELVLAVDNCAISDFKGKMTTWAEFGKLIYDVNANRDQLPVEMRQKVHALTDTCATSAGKIAVLYEYLKRNTRYVSIQLGIGGWQTFEASFVAEKGFGDCKALSNYMKAMLKEAGVSAYAVLVLAGEGHENYFIRDFPATRFNHMILCVPSPNDTTWLECTAKELPAGYLSSSTMNRDVLMLTPAGGVVVHTPHFDNDRNVLVRSAVVTFDKNNDLTATINCKYRGYWWDHESPRVVNEPKTKQELYFNHKYAIPTYTVSDFNVNNRLSVEPERNEQIKLIGSGNISIGGSHLFLSLAVFRNPVDEPFTTEKRTGDFRLSPGCRVIDTVVFHLPATCSIESNIKDIDMDFPFGSFHSKATLENNRTIRLVTRYDQKEGVYGADLYADFVKFCKAINALYTFDKIVLTNN